MLQILRRCSLLRINPNEMNLTEYSGTHYSKSGKNFRGDIRYCLNPSSRRPLVLVIHGFTAFGRWGFFPYLGRRLAESGAISAAMEFSFNDYDNAGESIVSHGLFASYTVGHELADISTAVSALREMQFPAWNGKIYLLGHSRGGGEAILTAAADSAIDKVAAWACISVFDRFTARQKRLWRETGFFRIAGSETDKMPLGMNIAYLDDAERPERDLLAAASKMRAELLLIHGAQDITVPPSEAKKISAVKSDSQLEIIPNAGHTFGISHPFRGTTSALEAAIDATLKFFTLQD